MFEESEPRDPVYTQEVLSKLHDQFTLLREQLSVLDVGGSFEDLRSTLESYESFFNPTEEIYNQSSLTDFFSNSELANLLKSGSVIEFLLLQQKEDNEFGFSLEPSDIACLQVLKERLKVSDEYASLDEVGIKNTSFKLRARFLVLEALQHLVTEGKQDTYEFELLDAEMVTPQIIFATLKHCLEAGKLDELSQDDREAIKVFCERDPEIGRQVDALLQIESETSKPVSVVEKEPRLAETSSALLAQLLAKPPIKPLSGSAVEFKQYVAARAKYFTEFTVCYQGENPQRASARLYALSEAYYQAVRTLQEIARKSNRDQLALDERTELLMLRTLAEKERAVLASERKKEFRKKLFGTIGRTFVSGLAFFAAQTVDWSRPQPERYVSASVESTDSATRVVEVATTLTNSPIVVESAAEGISIEATVAGPNQMFLDLLSQLQYTDTALYNKLVKVDETNIEAAERIAQTAGFWKLTETGAETARLYVGDKLDMNTDGTISFVRDGKSYEIFRNGEVINHDWLIS